LRPMPLFIEYSQASPLVDKHKFTIKKGPYVLCVGPFFILRDGSKRRILIVFQILAFSK
jgi:hypothetical protein